MHCCLGEQIDRSISQAPVERDTPLMKACRAGDLHEVKLLLGTKEGAEITGVSKVRSSNKILGTYISHLGWLVL